ncbi:MAG: pyroglutamyl-peptidase I [Ruminococcaceae bacterium]|nr:pyroglutamyl-peptidase I [Oscillospiraceae bacterium]
MGKLLITGFDPFGGEQINPAWEAVNALPEQVGEYTLCKLQIPTVFGLAAEKVLAFADSCHPDAILCIGQAGGRSAITPERIAVNIRDGKIPDNAGFRPNGEQVSADGPAAYFTTLPVADMVAAISTTGVPAVASNSAGAFVCNDTLYSLLHHYAGTAVRVGFIHVPYLPEQGTPNLPLADIVRGLEAAIFAL